MEVEMYDPLPSILQIRSMVDVTHATDRLSVQALEDVETIITNGGTVQRCIWRVIQTRDFLREVGRDAAAAACDLAIAELRRAV